MNPPPQTLRQSLNLSRVALAHPRPTVLLWLLVAIGGSLAAWRLPVAMFPDIVFPVIAVTAYAPEQRPEQLESAVTVPLEQRLLAVSGRGAVTARSSAPIAVLTVPFDVGVPMATAEQRVQTALAGVPLPAHVRLDVRQIDLNESPVVIYAVAGATPGGAERSGALERLAADLAKVRGVAHIVPLGLAGSPGASPSQRVSLDGVPMQALEVIKHAGANTLEVARQLDVVTRAAVSRDALRIVPMRAEAPFIREATGATLEALWIAVILAIIVIHPFLRSGRATLISALAIPTSLFGTFLVMALAGYKFESITLLALALVIGIVIDDAIVDVENIARHLPGAGSAGSAVLGATDEIGLTVTAATLTIVAVFVPVGLMGGVVGTFFRPFGLTISAAVLTSLAVARTLTPVLAARWLRAGAPEHTPHLWLRIINAYRHILGWSLQHPVRVLAAAIASLMAGIALIPLIPKGFIPVLDRGEFEVRYVLPPVSEVTAADGAVRQLVGLVGRDPDVLHVMAVTGSAEGDPNRGILHVLLRANRRAGTQAVERRLRTVLAQGTPLRVSVDQVPIIPVAAPQPLEITLTGESHSNLALAAQHLLQQVRGWTGMADVTLEGAGAEGDGRWLRYNGHPAAVIRGNLTGPVALGAISERVVNNVPKSLPPGVTLALEGESAQASEVFGHFASALTLAFFGVIAVLWVLFRNWQDPLTIAISLPLAVVGAMLGLWVARSDFGIVSLLGLVFLFGLVNKNAILLVDRVNQLRAAGKGRDEAILEAGPVRLRPIAMTTAAAVLAMMPLALGFGVGAELRAPMAVAIIGGLLTSTLLSLIVVPVVYQLLDRLRSRY